jgi:hypothetical protein
MSDVEIPAEVADAVDLEETQDDIETTARSMGWKSKDELKGADRDFIDAPEFVRRGREVLPIVNAHNAKLEKTVKRLETTLEKFADHHSKTEARAYARALSDLEARQAEAVEANDHQAVKEITKEMVALEKEVSKPKADEADDGEGAFEDWKSDNPWFDKDAGLRAAAIGIAEEIKNDFKDPIKQRAEVVKRVKAAFPEKFGNPNRTRAAAVEGVGAGPKSTGKSFSDLPPDAQKMCAEFERDIKGFKREQYVKEWFAK